MLKPKNNQLSIHSLLYNIIPENHTLKLIDKAVDFSFIHKLLEGTYNKYYGRPAKDPELMIRLLVIKYLYNFSDEKVIEEATYNFLYKWFLGLNPEDKLPHPSLLAKFRVHRLPDGTLDDIIVEIVRQCVEKGIIEDTGISIDATHTEANTLKCTPERLMSRIVKKMFKTCESEYGKLPEETDTKTPEYKEIEDHKEAKNVMKDYLESEMAKIEKIVSEDSKTMAVINNAKEILSDPKFMEQKGIRSIVDQDARVGHKSKNNRFFGYKTEFIMTTDERIITAVSVENGAYVDGSNFEELLELTKKTGLDIKEVYGDKAYFRKSIIDSIKKIEADPYIPVSEAAYRIDEEKFSYCKDSDQWFCCEGNHTVRKTHCKKELESGKTKETFRYYFEIEKCRNCQKREWCKVGKRVARMLEIGLNTPLFYVMNQQQKTDEFKKKYKKRACHEGKNGELKLHHGLDRAQGYGLKSMSRQSKLTAIAVNLKRIANILSSKKPKIIDDATSKLLFLVINLMFSLQNEIFERKYA